MASSEDGLSSPDCFAASISDECTFNDGSSPAEITSRPSTDQNEVDHCDEPLERAKEDDDDSKHNKYCHFCQHVKVKASAMLACSNKGCSRRFCEQCLLKQLGEKSDQSSGICDDTGCNSGWQCPICRKLCCCTQQLCSKAHRHCKAYRYRRRRAEMSARKHSVCGSTQEEPQQIGIKKDCHSSATEFGAVRRSGCEPYNLYGCNGTPIVSNAKGSDGSSRGIFPFSGAASTNGCSFPIASCPANPPNSGWPTYPHLNYWEARENESKLSPHNQRLLDLEGMKARSFIEEAQAPVVGMPVSTTANFASFSNMSSKNVYSSYSRMNRDSSHSADYDQMMHFLPSPMCENPATLKHEVGVMKCTTEEMIDIAADYLTAKPFRRSVSKPFEDRLTEGTNRSSAHLTSNKLRSQYGGSREYVSTMENKPSLLTQASPHDPYLSNAQIQMPLVDENFASCKRLIRTDSHERLSVTSSERVNGDNHLYSKGRRWGGSSENLRRLTTGMSPCSSFENLAGMVGQRLVRDRITPQSIAHEFERPRARGSTDDVSRMLYAPRSNLGPSCLAVQGQDLGARSAFVSSDQSAFPVSLDEDLHVHYEESHMRKNSSIDNLLATGVLNAGEGAYQFLAHSLSEIDLADLGDDSSVKLPATLPDHGDSLVRSSEAEKKPTGQLSRHKSNLSSLVEVERSVFRCANSSGGFKYQPISDDALSSGSDWSKFERPESFQAKDGVDVVGLDYPSGPCARVSGGDNGPLMGRFKSRQGVVGGYQVAAQI